MKKINLSLLSKGRYFRGVVTLGTLRYVDIEAPYVGEGGGGGRLINGSARRKRQIERGLRRGLGRRKLCPSPVSGTLLLNVLSQSIGGSFIFFHLIKVLTQLTPCTERN